MTDIEMLNAENARLTKLVIELRAEVVRLNAQAVPDGMVLVDRAALNTAISALRRDAKEGRPLRGKWAAALSAAPAAPPQPTSNHRPDRQWYERMIQETLDDDFEIGPAFDEKVKDSAAPAAPQPAQADAKTLTDEKDALLRQALEALEPFELRTSLAERTAEAIRNHLGVKND